LAQPKELGELEEFLVCHGTNTWNYLPQQGVEDQLQRLKVQTDSCFIATEQSQIIGMAIYRSKGDIPYFFNHSFHHCQSIYVSEVVVHKEHNGKGIGSSLIASIANIARVLGANYLAIDRHEQNASSAGMMRNAGFVELDCFADPARRSSGSKKTTTLCLHLKPADDEL
jgi:GNAT superfamily N-acetyltransferase